MITDMIIGGFLGFIRTLVSLIPDIPMPDISAGNGQFLSTAGSLNSILPLSTILIATAAALALRFGLVAWDAIVWVYHQFWGGS